MDPHYVGGPSGSAAGLPGVRTPAFGVADHSKPADVDAYTFIPHQVVGGSAAAADPSQLYPWGE
eukprot:1754675-Prorocentrum_lima.AAC.1